MTGTRCLSRSSATYGDVDYERVFPVLIGQALSREVIVKADSKLVFTRNSARWNGQSDVASNEQFVRIIPGERRTVNRDGRPVILGQQLRRIRWHQVNKHRVICLGLSLDTPVRAQPERFPGFQFRAAGYVIADQ